MTVLKVLPQLYGKKEEICTYNLGTRLYSNRNYVDSLSTLGEPTSEDLECL